MAKPKAKKRVGARDLQMSRGAAASVKGGVIKKQSGGIMDKRNPPPAPTPSPTPTPSSG